MVSGDPMVFQQQRDKRIADMVSGKVAIYNVQYTKENVRGIAESLIVNMPDCIDTMDNKSVAAYRVGIMELAKVLTGQSAAEADRETCTAMLDELDKKQ